MESRKLVLILTGVAVALIVVIGGLAVAMSVGGGGGNGNGNGDEQASSGQDLPARVQGEMRMFGNDPITLDPACASDASSANYIVEIFSGLLTFDKDLKLIPDIAQEVPAKENGGISADERTYTFRLRNNVLFHNGSRRVVAQDFKFSMERALNPRTLSTVGEVYLDDIVGAEDFIVGRAREVSGIKVVNDNTLEITIDQPKSYFLQKLTFPTAFVVDQRQVGNSTCFGQGANWTLRANGTGPFKLKQWVLGERIELEANPNYHLDPKPALAKATYLLSGGSPLVMYENDEIDLTGVGINDIERMRDGNDPLNKEFIEKESMDTYYIGFNTAEKPFDDRRVRQALSMAIDKEFLANNILKQLVVPAKGVLPPGIPGYNANLRGLSFNASEARRLLNEAGGPNVLRDVTILTSGQGASAGPIMDAIIAMWQENLGVTISVQQEEFGLFLRDLDQGNFQMFDLGWIADYPDAQNFLDIKLHSKSANNETAYSNPQVDQLLEQARTEKDSSRRIQLYQQAEELVAQDAPWIPLYHGKSNALIKPYVKGYVIAPFVIPNLRYVTISR